MSTKIQTNFSVHERLTQTQGAPKGKIFAQWEFPEYVKLERGIWWYSIAILSGGGLIWYAVSVNNFLFALIILLIAIIILTHHRLEPLQIMCTIYENGIQVGDKMFSWRDLERFWIIYQPPMVKRLYITPKSALMRREISIPFTNQNPVQLRKYFLDFVEEDLEQNEESLSDFFVRFLKL